MDDEALAFQLRTALAEDARQIRHLVHSERLNPLGLDWRRFTVAEDSDGNIVGCVQIKRHRDGSRELASLVVAPQWRGRRLGSCLVQQAKAAAGPPLWLMCRIELAPYYRQFDFVLKQDAVEMPAYFRRIFLPTRWLYHLLGRTPALAIMLWDTE